jgi:hypothetical protein
MKKQDIYIPIIIAVHKETHQMKSKSFPLAKNATLVSRILKTCLLDMLAHTGGLGDWLSSHGEGNVVDKLLHLQPLTDEERESTRSPKVDRASMELRDVIRQYKEVHPEYTISVQVERQLIANENMFLPSEV